MNKPGCVLGVMLLLLPTVNAGRASEETRIAERGLPNALSDAQVASGLKEALRVGAGKAVELTGRKDGYFGNEAIKILMPKNLRTMEKGLRAVGYGPKVDEFILSMNRAAEAAAPSAEKIFGDAIASMSFEDARKILTGGDAAATEYFKGKTTPQLAAAFHPIVEKTMDQNGVAQQYNQVASEAQKIPFMKSEDLDITDYVVTQALNGLFYMLADQERQIRKNPAARTTSLLKQVFGKKI